MVLLPAPDGPTSATISPGFHHEGDIVEHVGRRARRIAKRHPSKLDAARRRLRSGCVRFRQPGRRCQEFQQAFGGAGSTLDFAPDLAQGADGPGNDERIEDERHQLALGGAPREHVLTADPQHGPRPAASTSTITVATSQARWRMR